MIDLFFRGGPVMYLLLACSILVLTVIIERLLFWISVDLNRNMKLIEDVLELCRRGDWEAVRARVVGSKDFIIRVLVSGILHREFSMTKAMEATAAEEIRNMRRYMGVLDTMITVAPLLGIFGTVIGIDESKIEQAMMTLAGDMESMDEDDPKAMAHFMRRLSTMTGLELGEGAEEALSRLEAGEDPEQIESEMGDLFDGNELFSQKTIKGWKKQFLPPEHDDTLYVLD